LEALLSSGLSAVGFEFNDSTITRQQQLELTVSFLDTSTVRFNDSMTRYQLESTVGGLELESSRSNDSNTRGLITRQQQLELSVARFESTVDNVFNGDSTLILDLTRRRMRRMPE